LIADVVIPACDEADTIGDVIDASTAAPDVGVVIVVANGCSDDTERVAGEHGAFVVSIPEADKGLAMSVGAWKVQAGHVLFCDADLVGLTTDHVQGMLTLPPAEGQLCGLVDTPAVGITKYLPPITGQRRLPTDVARKLYLSGSGYEAELRIDARIGQLKLPHRSVVLRGVTNPTRAVTNPGRFLKMIGGVAAASLYLLPELVAYERGGLG
jgi:hypothetical protein